MKSFSQQQQNNEKDGVSFYSEEKKYFRALLQVVAKCERIYLFWEHQVEYGSIDINHSRPMLFQMELSTAPCDDSMCRATVKVAAQFPYCVSVWLRNDTDISGENGTLQRANTFRSSSSKFYLLLVFFSLFYFSLCSNNIFFCKICFKCKSCAVLMTWRFGSPGTVFFCFQFVCDSSVKT